MAKFGSHEIKITKPRLIAAGVGAVVLLAAIGGQSHDTPKRPPVVAAADGLPGLAKKAQHLPEGDVMPGCATRTEAQRAEFKTILGHLGLRPSPIDHLNPLVSDGEPDEPGIDTFDGENNEFTFFAAAYEGVCYADGFTGNGGAVSVRVARIPYHSTRADYVEQA